MRNKIIWTVMLAGVVTVTGCANNGQVKNQQAGAVIGGILGGVLGSRVGKGSGRTVAIIAGTMAGGYIGGSVGKSMDDTDRLKIEHSMEQSRTGVPTRWNNPDSGNAYTVTPTRTYEERDVACREYTVDAVIDGRTEQIYGTACRQPDGSWKAQDY
ncbi:MAG: glycine zipper 2TM domain-containing protein [Gammaproteobacteria bacterium]|nr:glycine zipper 2TM domain-containing protein [Gammaproteobacteria bacterium]